ncbi:NAD(P)H-dependent oxidoreductase [Endozoicomonas elysicola]|uniref:Potassium transporter KefG n=1 Tax=Endozoicomonas elysicola TaxID=305900 RepID=A0A081KCZ5_9GAMM|nr:NAD(P)H-dependent oxidoreductase [Endozoicomonas elysicola]KEI72021.1 potassium transporter KefG [Endozoicomonas elysicola]
MASHQQRVLILFAHPSQHRSEVNLPLFKASQGYEQVTVVDLYSEYPTLRINIEKEQQRLLEHDVVVFMFPLYWYSTPAILKEWQDLVLEYGFAYGRDGVALKDKVFLCALTAGGAEKAYHAEGYNHFTIRELLQPLEQTANLTGMHYLPPFALFGSRTAAEENRIEHHIHCWQQLLQALIENRIDVTKASKLNTLTEQLEFILKD